MQKFSYKFSHWLFGRALGMVCLIAFLSYWWQADALIGKEGLAPWEDDLSRIDQMVSQSEELSKWTIRPTLLWFQPLANHDLLFGIGTLSALCLLVGVLPFASAFIAYACYLSLMVVGEPFLSFQWDALLAETLILSLPFLPWTLFHRISNPSRISLVARLLIVGLLAKLMLESGIVKFSYYASDGSNTWRELTALDFHYWTQPLPHFLSPWIDSLPSWFDQFSLFAMYAVELILPFFLFMPGKLRRIGLFGQVILQIAILASGNYGFFNLLTLCLCIPLIDDQMLPAFFKKFIGDSTESSLKSSTLHFIFVLFLSIMFITTTYAHLVKDLQGNQVEQSGDFPIPDWIQEIQKESRIVRCFNSYGLFRVMTTTRPEIIIETSTDAENWHLLNFKWKPSHPNQKLKLAGPHMPRIDWQMWFEGLNFEGYAAHPFSRFLYGRFLQLLILGKDQSAFSDLPQVFGPSEFKALQQAPPHVQKQTISGYNQMINAFLSRSQWFGNLLRAIANQNETVMQQLAPFDNPLPVAKFIRVSLHHYSFSEDGRSTWDSNVVPHASYLFSTEHDTASYGN